MDLNLTNRVALVAGSSRGIGRSIAAALLAEGARVCITGRDTPSLAATAADLRQQYPGAQILEATGDLTDATVIAATMQSIQQQWGRLDILVANLGSGSGKPGWEQDESEWERLFNLNFFGSVRLAQAAIAAMTNGGSILFISSIVGIEATPAPLPYSAAKAALLNYSKNLARSVADKKIRVNSIAPGNILFPGGSWEKHLAARRASVEEYIAKEVPQQRFGTPEEIAALAAFLCSDAAAFTTGACYVMDGGQTRTL
ncbi:MAG: SDR family oxidoreductase [Acidobacteriaceae bacterium]|nr:SDR family oxidoreductase [Acidobacteriaceae bacterium]